MNSLLQSYTFHLAGRAYHFMPFWFILGLVAGWFAYSLFLRFQRRRP